LSPSDLLSAISRAAGRPPRSGSEEPAMPPTLRPEPAAVAAHQHFWPAGVRPADPRTAAIAGPFGPADLARELDGGEVGRTVLVQCAPGAAENDRLAGYAEA